MTINRLPLQFPDGSSSNWNGQYVECSLAGVAFPVESVEIIWSQDVVAHKKPNVPGAKIEPLSLNPHVFKIKALFINGLMRGPSDTWSTSLYPQVYNQIFTLLTDPTNPVITFVHPLRGSFNVRSVGGSSVTATDCYNGQEMTFELIQCNITDQVVQSDQTGSGSAASSAFDSLNPIGTFNLTPPAGFTTLSQLFNSVLAVIDTSTLDIQKMGWIVNNAKYMINRLNASLEALGDASTSLAQMYLGRTLSAINDIQNQKTIKLIKLKSYTLTNKATLAQVASQLNNTVEQLIQLNANITSSTTLPAGTKVLYNAE